MKQSILELYQKNHRGKENAISRDAFRLKYASQLNGLKDRDFRKIYSKLDICTCNEGGYWPKRSEEVWGFHKYMHSKAMAELKRAKRVREAHKELMNGQMELFL